jgi:4-hydroxy-tetrahydrodipicolinate synthase
MRSYEQVWKSAVFDKNDINGILPQIHYNQHMQNFPDLSGVYAAALTPLTSDGSLALDDLQSLLSFLAKRGCHGALLFGTTGEGPSFSPSERSHLLQTVQIVRQSLPGFRLLAGTGTPSLEETIDLTRAAFDLGYDGVVVLPPYYYRKVSLEGLYTWFSQVIHRSVPTGGALFGYHIPGVSGVPLPIELLARLKDDYPHQFAGIKDSSGDPDHARQLGNQFGKDLLVFNGNDPLFNLALNNSASGCITAMANIYSPYLRKVWDAFQIGEYDPNAQSTLQNVRAVLDRYPPAPPLLKAMLARRHEFPRWSVRPPLMPLPDNLVNQIELELEESLTI